jgi:site-specific DNA recombinase
MLNNPAYTGRAVFGRFHYMPPQPQLRPLRGRTKPSLHPVARVPAPCDEWIYIPVTPIVDEAAFEAGRAQLVENKKRKRDRESGHVWLLQGLTVCRRCGYALYGKTGSRTRSYDKSKILRYYRCTGTDGQRFEGEAVCSNTPLRADHLEEVVWDRVKALLKEPERVADEYRRRLAQADADAAAPEEVVRLAKQIAALRRGIDRLIDGYAEGFVEKSEFEPRITGMKQRLSQLAERHEAAVRATQGERDLCLVICHLEGFAAKVSEGLDRLEPVGQREIIRALVKRIDVDNGEIEIMFRVPPPDAPIGPQSPARDRPNWQQCTAVPQQDLRHISRIR